MHETKLFYTPLWEDDLSVAMRDWIDHRERMLSKIYELERASKGVAKTNFGGWQSDDEIYVHPEFGWLMEHILRLSNQVAAEYAPEFKFNNGHIWANINRRNNFNAVHTHPNSLLSGVAYLNVSSEDQGQIQFFDAREGTPTNHWPCFFQLPGRTPLTDDTFSVKPTQGKILFFPSWLKHWVTPNLTDEDRISVSFNLRAT